MKLDLHTHCREATVCATPTPEIVGRIVAAIKDRGLDGIAVTEHYTDTYGYEVRDIVRDHFDNEVLIIPGKECDRVFLGIEKGMFHVVELHLPGGVVFRFIAHPGHPHVRDLGGHIDDGIHGIELRNAMHHDDIDEDMVRRLAREHDLVMLSNSDAHSLRDIGYYYNDMDIERLCWRARRSRSAHASP